MAGIRSARLSRATGVVGIGRGAFALSLEPRIDAPTSVAAGAGRVSFWTASAALVPCLRFSALAACGVVGGGVLRGAGEEVPGARTGIAPWMAVGARLAWYVPLGTPSLALRLHGDLLAVPLRTALRVGSETAWTTPAVSGALGLVVIVRFR